MENNRDFGWKLRESYQKLPSHFYKRAKENIYPNLELVIYNEALAKELGLKEKPLEEELKYLAGSVFPKMITPIHQAYGGHQFGYFNILGDGRATLLGEQRKVNGEYVDIQLKGSGRNDYSRGGDGKASLGPMLREYLISEGMHVLGIDTTRSLAVIKTGENVYRNEILPGAILTRVAASHIRVGTFEFAALFGADEVKALADYSIQRHEPNLMDAKDKYLLFFQNVIARQAKLIAKWMAFGFIHGVMNTDNITISGETIDYGPCAFMDEYHPDRVFSSIDTAGRYRFFNQPLMGTWAMARFGEALLPILDDNEELALAQVKESIGQFKVQCEAEWINIMKGKLGLLGDHAEDEILITELLELMESHQADYTNTFIRLSLHFSSQDICYLEGTNGLFESELFKKWRERWLERIAQSNNSKEEIFGNMKERNPFVIPRNYYVEEALEAAVKDNNMKPFHQLLKVLQSPFDYEANVNDYQMVKKIEGYQTFCGT